MIAFILLSQKYQLCLKVNPLCVQLIRVLFHLAVHLVVQKQVVYILYSKNIGLKFNSCAR